MPEQNDYRVTLGSSVSVGVNGSDLVDDFSFYDVVVNLSDGDYPNFLEYSDERIYEFAVVLANESIEHIHESLLHIRDLLRQADEEAEVIDAHLNQEPDWEV